MRLEAKMQISVMVNGVMPGGKPEFKQIRSFPAIAQMAQVYGETTMQKALFLMVKDFSESINAVRNMNETQMIDAAAMLLAECDNFRLEDYLMMFTMAKRGQLVTILDRVDMHVISLMMNSYWDIRNAAGNKMLGNADEFEILDSPAFKQIKDHIDQNTEQVSSALMDWKQEIASDKAKDLAEEEKQSEEKTRKAQYGIALAIGIPDIVKRMYNGEKLTSDYDLQFYQNYSKEIEESLQNLRENPPKN